MTLVTLAVASSISALLTRRFRVTSTPVRPGRWTNDSGASLGEISFDPPGRLFHDASSLPGPGGPHNGRVSAWSGQDVRPPPRGRNRVHPVFAAPNVRRWTLLPLVHPTQH